MAKDSPEQDRTFEVPRHATTLRRGLGMKITAVVALSLLIFGVSGFAFAANRLQGNITVSNDISQLLTAPTVSATPADPNDPNAGQALNILILGSDVRDGGVDDSGVKVSGMRADTTLIAHISGDRSRVQMVSIARDTLVNIPACHLDYDPDGKMTKARKNVRFNEAFSLGGQSEDVALGAACAINTVTQETGIPISDFVVVDFNGFQSMVDAVGGVTISLDKPMFDEYTGLNLPAGPDQTLMGEQALAFMRARHVVGTDGSDTQRIGRQQIFLGALANKVLSAGTITNPAAMAQFLTAVTESLTVSQGLNMTSLVGLAWSLKGIDPANIQFVTVPWGDSGDGATVKWTKDANAIWEAVINDQPIQGTVDANGNEPAATPTDTAPTDTSTSGDPTDSATP